MPRLLLALLAIPACALLRSGPPKPEPAFVRVPGGTFEMGDPAGNDAYALPVHPVAVEPFDMMFREVTFADFDRFADARAVIEFS